MTAHFGAMAVLIPLDLPIWTKLVTVGVLGVSLIHSLRHYVLGASPWSLDELLLSSEGEWRLTTVRGETYSAELLPSAFVHPWLIALRFKVDGRTQPVVIMPDQGDPETLRRLRVRLRM
ncbi:MAG: hypothetical protein L0Y67_00175 [Gammaproteobacteria bacterium]|nr:hypothetical protein [Gammaproteobacteria bacterium]MCI0590023.1 hypothetical protein [Gammaproteobacteria bacterium]